MRRGTGVAEVVVLPRVLTPQLGIHGLVGLIVVFGLEIEGSGKVVGVAAEVERAEGKGMEWAPLRKMEDLSGAIVGPYGGEDCKVGHDGEVGVGGGQEEAFDGK